MRELITTVFLILIFTAGVGVGFVAGIVQTEHLIEKSQELNTDTKALLKRAERQACGIYL